MRNIRNNKKKVALSFLLVIAFLLNITGTWTDNVTMRGVGSISGFLWVDENENGLYDEDEQPLADYTVSLYAAEDLTVPIAQTQTDLTGKYIFDKLVPGNYVVGLAPDEVDGEKYLPPLSETDDNKFVIDRDIILPEVTQAPDKSKPVKPSETPEPDGTETGKETPAPDGQDNGGTDKEPVGTPDTGETDTGKDMPATETPDKGDTGETDNAPAPGGTEPDEKPSAPETPNNGENKTRPTTKPAQPPAAPESESNTSAAQAVGDFILGLISPVTAYAAEIEEDTFTAPEEQDEGEINDDTPIPDGKDPGESKSKPIRPVKGKEQKLMAFSDVIVIDNDSTTDIDAGMILITDEAPKRAPGGAYGEYTVTEVLDGSKDHTITTSGGIYEVTGDGDKAIIITNADCVLILTGITREHWGTRLQIYGTSNVIIYLAEGTVNKFTSTGTSGDVGVDLFAGISLASSATLTIKGSGRLETKGGNGGAGIGGSYRNASCGEVIIENGTVIATGGSNAAGIGGSLPNGTSTGVTINGGIVEARGGSYGAGIGGGNYGVGSNVTITDGIIMAQGGSNGAGIGGGGNGIGGSVTVTGGDVKAYGGTSGAGIGGGSYGGGGSVTITDGNVTVEGGSGGAGIGGGLNSTGGITEINGGTVTVGGGTRGAGIGGGNGGAGGTTTINEGTVTATSGCAAAGIGGGLSGKGGTTVINGGYVKATGGFNDLIIPANFGGAGIGGGGSGTVAGGNQPNSSGDITINGGTVIAHTVNNGAGIGGGRNGYADNITINGGDITATTTNGGAGIGGGGSSHCGNIIITGGNIYAKSSLNAAGIGNGIHASGGSIKITGGIIHGESQSNDTSGVGGGGGGSAAINITGGSVFSVNPSGNIRVNFNPTNGTDHVYLIGVKLVDDDSNIIPHTDISVQIAGSTSYLYHATTNSQGIAYLWLPAGTHDFLMYNPDNGTYLDYSMEVTKPTNTAEYDPATNTGQIQLSSNYPKWSFIEVSHNVKAYESAIITLDIYHNNTPMDVDKREIASVKWYRESVENPLHTKESFNSGYAAAAPANKGDGGGGETLDLVSTDGPHEHHYSMSVSENGRYWIQIHYKGANTGKDVYHVAHIDVDNIYTPVDVYVQDWNTGSDTEIKPYARLALSEDAPYGVPFDLDGAMIKNPSLGYDTVTYPRNAALSALCWDMTVPGSPFAATAVDAVSSVITLDRKIDNSEDKTVDSDATHKYFTVNYTRNSYIITAGLTISKEVTGGNTSQDFTFTITFMNSAGKPLVLTDPLNYIGGILSDSGATAPEDATLEPDINGKATFTLRHGQSITILDVPADAKIQIEEAADENYTTTFLDSERTKYEEGNDTGVRDMTEDPRSFHFINERFIPAPTGIDPSNTLIILLLPILAILAGLIGFTIRITLRRRRRQVCKQKVTIPRQH